MNNETIRRLLDEFEQGGDLLYQAWGVIANVSDGDWTRQSDEWEAAAARWRDHYHAWLDTQRVGAST